MGISVVLPPMVSFAGPTELEVPIPIENLPQGLVLPPSGILAAVGAGLPMGAHEETHAKMTATESSIFTR